ncbi:MAG: glycoside hydrolase family 5 protein [Lachnospiraceae bacterium]|nr:glycoside hydrolase family 5 protein [Lachnospiraceae bacterium]
MNYKVIISKVIAVSLVISGVMASSNICFAKTPALHVEGTRIVSDSGKIVSLKGISTHGLPYNWDTKSTDYINKKAFKRLRDDWHANTVRIPVYTDTPYGGKGYCNVDEAARKEYRKWVNKAVKYATSLGMYIIIDWHILDDNNPRTHEKMAKKFFATVSKKYADHDNVIYEICNEPHWVSWQNDIRPYALKITKTIRKYDDDALIIVGTNTWSQDVDEVAGSMLPDDNTVYALHFYAATHGDFLIEKAKRALEAGVPVFISECNICDSSGNGNLDKSSGAKWMKLIREYDLPYVVWALSHKQESASLISNSCNKNFGWKTSELTEAGKWWRKQMRKG